MSRKTYEEAEQEHDAWMARVGAIEDAGITGDLRGIVACLRHGNVDEDILNAAASIIERSVMTPQYQARVTRRDADFWRSYEIRRAFEDRLEGPFGQVIEKPMRFEDLRLEMAEKFDISERQVEKILAASGYKGQGRHDSRKR